MKQFVEEPGPDVCEASPEPLRHHRVEDRIESRVEVEKYTYEINLISLILRIIIVKRL